MVDGDPESSWSGSGTGGGGADPLGIRIAIAAAGGMVLAATLLFTWWQHCSLSGSGSGSIIERGYQPGGTVAGLPRRTVKCMAVLCLWGFLCCTAGGLVQSPLTELLMQRACERQNIDFGTRACDKSEAAQSEATYRNTYLQLGSQAAGFVSIGVASVMADSLGRKPALTLITVGSVLSPAFFWLLPMGPLTVGGQSFDGFWLILIMSTAGALFGSGAFLSVSSVLPGGLLQCCPSIGFSGLTDTVPLCIALPECQ